MSLEALFTKAKKVTYREVDFEINELTLEHVPDVAHLVEKFLNEKGDSKNRIASILKSDTETIKKLVVSLANIKKEDINKLPIDVIIFLAGEIVTSNIEYVKKNVVPMVQGLAKKAK